jgi:hypothetical protein
LQIKYIYLSTPRSVCHDESNTLLGLVSLSVQNTQSSKPLLASSRSDRIPEMAAITFLPPSDAMTMSQGPTVWRTSEEDWEHFRAHIRQLYLEEDRPLKDVMTVMKRDYGFKATSDPTYCSCTIFI